MVFSNFLTKLLVMLPLQRITKLIKTRPRTRTRENISDPLTRPIFSKIFSFLFFPTNRGPILLKENRGFEKTEYSLLILDGALSKLTMSVNSVSIHFWGKNKKQKTNFFVGFLFDPKNQMAHMNASKKFHFTDKSLTNLFGTHDSMLPFCCYSLPFFMSTNPFFYFVTGIFPIWIKSKYIGSGFEDIKPFIGIYWIKWME